MALASYSPSLWDFIEHRISDRNRKRYREFPLLCPEKRAYNPSDVSIIIPTVDTDPTFSECLGGLLKNKPLEVLIITTVEEEDRVRALVRAASAENNSGRTDLHILTVPKANKRDQLLRGINASKGGIMALVDDDAFWQHDTVLDHLLAPFQQEDIGLVGGPITSYLPSKRKNPDIITPWEVAAIRLRSKRHGSMKCAYEADGGINFCVSGVTALLRSEIARDPALQSAFGNDMWMGQRQNSGDDSFITRWVLFQHLFRPPGPSDDQKKPRQWKLGMQLTKEAEVGTSIMLDSRFAGQMKRWYRSGLRHRLMCLLYEPGLRGMYRTCPHMTRKMVEGMLNPVLLWVRLYCFWRTFHICPWFASFVLGIKLYGYINGLVEFANEYPFATRYLWAAVLVDRLYLISDWYCWITLGTEAWMTRQRVDDNAADVVAHRSGIKEE
ncbi:uncharacterized protein A1O5_12233 [Cladophialophora psammophila CBS 110553]|uniref:Glycosyltransferase 2-like domain-containing protein n=1 Tax=Cladophialophora psammophila CBS 110553 TaxID=1182543 RepID=W9VUH1_9EURO|nr:uncharacterized protein A1O5_12233 [Cladophialophora psammophila CBS 110553]EXJ59352.1 hypothetical protein A1O5_12233 [Cladophialophora psammophila CBS 110553]